VNEKRGVTKSFSALQVHAGPRARAHLREHGLRANDVRVVPAAAGGPKGLVLLPLDQYIFGHWLPAARGLTGLPATALGKGGVDDSAATAGGCQPVHLLGASIGAWRLAAACARDPVHALQTLAEDYITQSYPHALGRMPSSHDVSRVLAAHLQQRFTPLAPEILNHPHHRLHVFTSRGLRLLHRPRRATVAVGWLGAFAANALGRAHLGTWMERVVFSDPRTPLPFALQDFKTTVCDLNAENLCVAVLASCSIPYALQPVQDVPGGPLGTYWDGGITDYHLHLNYCQMVSGLVLYPHFVDHVVPGWLDKAFKRRHAATPFLDNLVLVSPRPEWVQRLPGGKLPDRQDFKTWGDDEAGRQRVWRAAYTRSQQLAEEFAQLVSLGRGFDAQPLA
jgi:hypothetical protein